MKNCLLIIPYFGYFPNYFQLFLDSCAFNKDIDFLILTDDRRNFNYPQNVLVKYCSFGELKGIIKNKIDDRITFDLPMKLCDFRPAYGYLFAEYLDEYKYWGHCDIDLIFGDLNSLLIPIITTELYDKIFNLGHLTLYRNREDINKLFFQEINEKGDGSVFFKQNMCKFDEENHNHSIVAYAIKNNLKIYTQQLEADIATKSNTLILDLYDFVTNSHKYVRQKNLFIFDNGKVKQFYLENKKLKMREYIYIHLQKRKMEVMVSPNINRYVIAANRFYVPDCGLEYLTDVKFKQIKTFFPNLHYINLRFKNLKTKMARLFK